MRDFSSSLPRFAHRLVLACALFLGALSFARAAVSDPTVEYRLKAAYLYNFTKFVEWPTDAVARTPFLVGVIDPEGTAARIIAETLGGKSTADGRPIIVRRFEALSDEIAGCHQLFLTRAAGITPADARAFISATSILLIGETDSFAQQGGVIGLVVSGDSVRCEVNLAGAQRAGVKLSGRLASVSRLVRETAQP
jgi:hypothetical protein